MKARLALLTALGMQFLFSIAYAGRSYTVDDMLRLEHIGRAVIAPDGRHIVFERLRPYEKMPDFGRNAVPGAYRSKLYVLDLNGDRKVRPLFDQASDEGYGLASFSSDGKRLAYFHTTRTRYTAKVFDLATGRHVEFAFRPEWDGYSMPQWVTSTKLIYQSAGPGRFASNFERIAERNDILTRAWETKRAGRTATASSIGSGRYEITDARRRTGDLVLADAADGTHRVLGKGRFETWMLSPDKTRIAALRKRLVNKDLEDPLAPAAGPETPTALVVFDLVKGRSTEVCAECDVFNLSLDWSPSSEYLSFYARPVSGRWNAARVWIYDRAIDRAAPVELASVTIDVDREPRYPVFNNVPTAWLGDALAVRVKAQVPARTPYWKIFDPERQQFSEDFPVGFEVVGIHAEGLLLTADGELWLLDAAKRKHLLTGQVPEPVRIAESRGGKDSRIYPDDIVLLAGDPGCADASSRIVFLNILTRRTTALDAPAKDAALLVASPSSAAALFRHRSQYETVISLVHSNDYVELARINSHLNEVSAPNWRRIDHVAQSGQALTSWILLPENFKTDEPVPTVSHIYPGRVYSGAGPEATGGLGDLDSVSWLNPNLLASRGYAVLLPSIPTKEFPRDPMDGLADTVLSAVDAAIAAGFTDADRLAIEGHSFGGYGTAAVVSQTNRFKAAIAMAGLYNLISAYGVFNPEERLTSEFNPLERENMSYSERGQTGMGAPPWRDAQRYLRNSPLMHVESIDTPILLIHGDLDKVSITQPEELFTAMTRLKKDAVFLRYWGEDHSIKSPANIRDSLQRRVAWYDQHLDITRDEQGRIIFDGERARSRFM